MSTKKNSAQVHGQGAVRRVVLLGLPPVDALDVIGPAEVFAFANYLSQEAVPPYRLELISAGPEPYMQSGTGIGLQGHGTLAGERNSADPIDTLIVTSGIGHLDRNSAEATEWIRLQAGRVRRLCSICVGAFALAESGILDGKRATTHWQMTSELARRYPQVLVDPRPIWIRDGNVYTSAGISTGIDLALALVAEDLGAAYALEIAKNLVLFLRRPSGQAQFSASLSGQAPSSSKLHELQLWITEHLDHDITVDVLADQMSMSKRTLIRLFQRELQTTPARYVEGVRLEAASRELEMSDRSIEDVAARCGYRSVDVLRRAFIRNFGLSPREYAKRFETSIGPS